MAIRQNGNVGATFRIAKRVPIFGVLFVLAALAVQPLVARLVDDMLGGDVVAFSIMQVSPDIGPTAGGTDITITGTDLDLAKKNLVQVAAGYNHSLGVSADGRVYTWGLNGNGLLGNGTAGGISDVPIDISSLGGSVLDGVEVIAVAAGYYHSLALSVDGQVYAWGESASGQLGRGDNSTANSPVNISAIAGSALNGKRIKSIEAGGYHSFAVDEDGEVYAWGENGNGQLGNGVSGAMFNPNPINITASAGSVLGGVEIAEVSAGFHYTLAMSADGRVFAWGDNTSGQLGDGTAISASLPIEVGSVAGSLLDGVEVVDIVAGDNHSLAVGADGRVFAWGLNYYGQLGDGTNSNAVSPVDISSVVGSDLDGVAVARVIAGGNFSLAIDEDGSVYAWGWNDWGQLGNGTTADRVNFPVGISGVANSALNGVEIVTMAAGDDYTLAADADGQLYAWGGNSQGQLGNGNTAGKVLPIAIAPLTVVLGSGASAAACRNIVVAADGNSLSCTTSAHTLGWVDVTVSNEMETYTLGKAFQYKDVLDIASITPATGPTAGGTNVVIKGVGINLEGRKMARVDAGDSHTVAMDSDGNVYAWGQNTYGQLGNGEYSSYVLVPVAVSANAGSALEDVEVVDVVAGSWHSLALSGDGRVFAWGLGGSGQLGNGNAFSNPNAPVDISDIPGSSLDGVEIVAIAAGMYHSLALDVNGEVHAWGSNMYGQLGNGVVGGTPNWSAIPVNISAVAGSVLDGVKIVDIVAGDNHSLAVGADGRVFAWGQNNDGQLGNGVTGGNFGAPIDVTGVAGSMLDGVKIVGVAAGMSHSLAFDEGGELYGWGLSTFHQLGIGTAGTYDMPVNISAYPGSALMGVEVVGAAGGNYHSLVVSSMGEVFAWGDSGQGQLGMGSIGYSTVPMNISAFPNSALLDGDVNILAAGSLFSAAVDSDGRIFAWGYNGYGQLGDNTAAHRNLPVAVLDLPPSALVQPVKVTFGGIAATNVVRVDDTTIHAVAPAHTAGSVDVTANTGKDTAVLAGGFRYKDPISVSAVTPSTGAVVGGTMVTITGKNLGVLDTNMEVTFGGVAATDVELVNDTTIVAVAPAHIAGIVDVVVSDGVDSVVLKNRFRFAKLLDALSVTPDSGSVVGGTRVTIDGENLDYVSADIVQLDAGYYHTLALSATGQVYAWGDNTSGQLGDGTTDDSDMPINISTIAGSALNDVKIVAVAAGSYYSLALSATGEVFAWGHNDSGQLGDGTHENVSMPMNISAIAGSVLRDKNIESITAGNYHSLALDSDGRIFAWGVNYYGQLGNLSNTDSSMPVEATGIVGSELFGIEAVRIVAGSAHSLAVDADGLMYAWGRNAEGQLGNGSILGGTHPICVNDVAGSQLDGVEVADIAAGDAHSLAIADDGRIFAWGDNTSGQLGDGSVASKYMPVDISAGSVLDGVDVVGIVAGHAHSLAVDADGRVYTWGSNNSGQLGDGGVGDVDVPVDISARAGSVLEDVAIVSVVAGYENSFAMDVFGQVYAWGDNARGQLGDGTSGVGANAEPENISIVPDTTLIYPLMVVFGGANAVDVVRMDGGDVILATTPAHDAGVVDVLVSNGLHSVVLTGAFTFVPEVKAPDTGLFGLGEGSDVVCGVALMVAFGLVCLIVGVGV